MPLPLVTALVRTYQSARTLPFAIASVLAQTVDDLECLVVDDGSTDGTGDVVSSFGDPRVRYLRHDKNLGRAAARKTGLAAAQGRFIGLLDADDWWYPWKLERQLDILHKEPELPIVSCGMILLDGSGRPTGVEQSVAEYPSIVRYPAMRAPAPLPFPNAPALSRMEVVRHASIDTNLRRCEDFDFFLQVLLRESSALWPEPLYACVLPETSRLQAHVESAAAARRVYSKYVRSYPLPSLRRQLECVAKQVAYAAWARASKHPRPPRRRGRPATPKELADFERARSEVVGRLRV